MTETFLGMLGIMMFASWAYMLFAQFKTIYKERDGFGKMTTWFAIVTFILFVIGTVTQYSNA